jgi:protein-disulfide isomerase
MKASAVLLALLVCGSTSALAQEAPREAKTAERAAMSRLKGADNAAVTVYEIADFQCPYCGRFAREVMPKIDSAYVKTGKAKWIFVNFPLPTHANSWAAAEAAMCAGGVSEKFWPMHEKLFAAQAEWSNLPDPTATFASYAKAAGVAAAPYASCVASDQVATLLVRDVLNAAGTGLSGTPAYIVNSEPMFTGFRSFEDWKQILEAALKKASTTPAK